MKNILISLVLLFSFTTIPSITKAQNPIQQYGHTAISNRTVSLVKHYPYAVATIDTLTAVDTCWFQFQYPNLYYTVTDLNVRTLTGTLAGTAVLYGAYGTTMPTPTSTAWHALTANTTYCTGCVGASATLTGSGTTQYEWHMPAIAMDYQNYQVRVIVTGTCTATPTLTSIYKN